MASLRHTTGPRSILARAGVGAAGHIVQRSDTISRRIIVEAATLILVEEGTKRIRWSGGEAVATAGEALSLQAGEVVDISNTPGKSGAYRALWICWSPSLLGAAARKSASVVRHRLSEAFRASYYRAFDALGEDEDLPARVASHRLGEVLLWLAERKFHFAVPPPASLGQRVRSLLAADPSATLSMDEVARETATSIPTLRRKLAAEGVAFRDLVEDVRMSHALALLQNTDEPVLQIALATGYASPSRFTARFRARFGYVPTAIRGHHRGGAS